MSNIEIEIEPTSETTESESVADAVEEVIEVSQSEDIGMLKAQVAQLCSDMEMVKSQCSLHDDLINLHDHSPFVTGEELNEVEDRITAVIQTPSVEEEIEVESESTDEGEAESESESESTDEPPRSRKQKKSIADRYYGR